MTGEYAQLLWKLDSVEMDFTLDDEVREIQLEQIKKELELTEADIETKIAARIYFAKRQEGEIDTIDKEIKLLQGRKKTRENRVKWNKQGIIDVLKTAKDRKAATELWSASLSPKIEKGSLKIDDESKLMLSRGYYKSTPKLKEIKEALLSGKIQIIEAWPEGESLPANVILKGGVHWEPTETLRIR